MNDRTLDVLIANKLDETVAACTTSLCECKPYGNYTSHSLGLQTAYAVSPILDARSSIGDSLSNGVRIAGGRMATSANFSVNTRLTRILGETYRSSESALKELVDNAWDADALNVWLTLPSALSGDSIVVVDDGSGMTAAEMRGEYLNIASDKRTRSGDRTKKFNRRVKGRKGIGKFAGLILASKMQVSAVARGKKCSLIIDKKQLLEHQSDLESVALPFEEIDAAATESGTCVTLSDLDNRLNFPTAERLREILVHEYGREDGFKVFVDGVALSVEDVPGNTTKIETDLITAGKVVLHFTIAEGKKLPKQSGIILKVDGKVVGKPMTFGLEDDLEIPKSLLKRILGEVELNGVEEFVTADWGGIIENSKVFQEAREYIQSVVKKELRAAYAQDMALQKARLQKQINQRLLALPEFRRQNAQEAVQRILQRFYGESDERISVIVDVTLDAIERDVYWTVLEHVNKCSDADISTFAKSLDQFGMVELAGIAQQAARRLEFLDHFDKLLFDPKTREKDVHIALENNLWLLGRQFTTMASNVTLRRIIKEYCDKNYSEEDQETRPDLLLSQDYNDSYLLIEFKRPSNYIKRIDIAQAETYRDKLSPLLATGSEMTVLMVGKGCDPSIEKQYLHGSMMIRSYASLISSARSELGWLISSLTSR